MDNSETLATLDTQDTGQRQTKQGAIKYRRSRDTGNIEHTRHRTKTNKTHNSTRKTKKTSNIPWRQKQEGSNDKHWSTKQYS
jgi:hypothetical protein